MLSRRNPKVRILLQISAMTGLLLSCSGGYGTTADECPFESIRILLPGGLGGKNSPLPSEAGSGFSMHGKDHYHSAWESVVYSIQVSEKPYLPQIEEASKEN